MGRNTFALNHSWPRVNLIHSLMARFHILLSCSSFEIAICYLSWKQFFSGQRKWPETASSFSQAYGQDSWAQKLATEWQSPNRDGCCSSPRLGSELGRWCLSPVANVLLLKKSRWSLLLLSKQRKNLVNYFPWSLFVGWGWFLWSGQLLFFSVAFWGDGTPLSQEISFITLELEMQGRKERIKILYKGQRKLKACNLKPLARSCGTSYFCWEGIPLVESG